MLNKIVLDDIKFQNHNGTEFHLSCTEETVKKYNVKFLERIRTPFGLATFVGQDNHKLWFWKDSSNVMDYYWNTSMGDMFSQGFSKVTSLEELSYPSSLRNKIIELFKIPPEIIVKHDYYFGVKRDTASLLSKNRSMSFLADCKHKPYSISFTQQTSEKYNVHFLQRIRTPDGFVTIIGEYDDKLWFWPDKHLTYKDRIGLHTWIEVKGNIFNRNDFSPTLDTHYPPELKKIIYEHFHVDPVVIRNLKFCFGAGTSFEFNKNSLNYRMFPTVFHDLAKAAPTSKIFPTAWDSSFPIIFTPQTAKKYNVKFLERVRTPEGLATVIGEYEDELWVWYDTKDRITNLVHLKEENNFSCDGYCKVSSSYELFYPPPVSHYIFTYFGSYPEEIVKYDYYYGEKTLSINDIKKLSEAETTCFNDDFKEKLLGTFEYRPSQLQCAISKLFNLYLQGNETQVTNSAIVLEFIFNFFLEIKAPYLNTAGRAILNMLGEFLFHRADNFFTDKTDKIAYPLLFFILGENYDEDIYKQQCYLKLFPTENCFPHEFNLAQYCEKNPAEFMEMFKTLMHEDNPFSIYLKIAIKNDHVAATLEYAQLLIFAVRAQKLLNKNNNNETSEINLDEAKESVFNLFKSPTHDAAARAVGFFEKYFPQYFDFLVIRSVQFLADPTDAIKAKGKALLQQVNTSFTNYVRDNGIYTKSELDFAYYLYQDSIQSRSTKDTEKALTIIFHAAFKFDPHAINYIRKLSCFKENVDVLLILLFMLNKIGCDEVEKVWMETLSNLNNNNVRTDFFKIRTQMMEKFDHEFIQRKHAICTTIQLRVDELLKKPSETVKVTSIKNIFEKIKEVSNLVGLNKAVSDLAMIDDFLATRLPKDLVPDTTLFL